MNRLFLFILLLISAASAFSQSPDTLYPVKVFTESGYKYGYINNQGYLRIKPQYAFAKNFSEGLAFVKTDNNSNKWFCVNTSGMFVFELFAVFVKDFKDGYANFIKENDSLGCVLHDGKRFNDTCTTLGNIGIRNLHPFQKNNRWGYKSGYSDTVLPAIYERAGEFSEGLAPVFIKFNESDLPADNCYNAFINEKGDIIIKAELKYDDKGYLESGYFYSPEKWVNGVCRYYTSNDPLTRAEKYIRSDGKIIW